MTYETVRPGKLAFILGWVLTAIPAVMMGAGGLFMLFVKPDVAIRDMGQAGYPPSAVRTILIIEIAVALLYVFPKTAILGGLLMMAYLGGAVATHVRTGDGQWYFAVIFGVIAWLGLYLRDRRVRALVPWRWG